MKRCHKYHFLYLQLIVRKVMPHVMITYTNYPGLWLVRAISKTRLSISTCQGLYSKRQTLSLSNYSIDCLSEIDDEIAQCNCKPTKLCDLSTVSVVNCVCRRFALQMSHVTQEYLGEGWVSVIPVKCWWNSSWYVKYKTLA